MASCTAIVGDGAYSFPVSDASTEPAADGETGDSGIPSGGDSALEAGESDDAMSGPFDDGGPGASDGSASDHEAVDADARLGDGFPETAAGGSDGSADSGGRVDATSSRGADAGRSDGGVDSGGRVDAAAPCGPGGCADSGCISCSCDAGAFAPPEQLTGIDPGAALYSPTLSADGKTLYVGVVAITQEQIYVATRPDDGTVFALASPVASVNSTSSDGTPFLTQDGLSLYFYSTRPGGLGSRDIWTAQRTTPQADFAPPVPLSAVNGSTFDAAPWVSADALTMTFVSNRPGVGGADIYIATRNDVASPFSPPVLLGGVAVNSTSNEDRGVMTRDGLTLYFGSDRGNANGVYDLWVATRVNVGADFANATKLQVLNSAGNDMNAFLTVDERELYFSSDRTGTQQIWRSVRQCP